MAGWSFLLAPLAVLAVLVLFRFVGCDYVFRIDHLDTGPTGTDYSYPVLSDNPVSYWRLQEKHSAEPSPGPTVPNAPVAGSTAKDERGANDGTYKAVIVQPPPQLPDSPAAPGGLMLEAAGLLDLGGTNTSLSIDGGYVEVPFSNSLSLQSFTIEALAFPGWDTSETGLYRSVITLNMVDLTPGSNKAFGFGLFAGPNDPGALSGPDVWQIWLADGTTFLPIKDPNRPSTLVDFTKTNYLAVTYDDTTKILNMYVYVQGIDLDSGVGHPVKDVTVAAFSPLADPTQSLLIGMHRPPLGGTIPVFHPFKGRIQEVAVYSEALSIARVMSHIMAGLNV